MSDTLPYDPNFPDRPMTPDFKALSEVVCALDAQGDAGADMESVTRSIDFDFDSLLYMAKQRAARLAAMLGKDNDLAFVRGLVAVYIDAFITGIKLGDKRTLAVVDATDGNRRTG